MAEVKLTSHAKEYLDALEDAKAQALEMIGLRAERHAKERCHVDTGRLRNSITHATESTQGRQYSYADDKGNPYGYQIGTGAQKDYVYVGTNVEYAPFVEMKFPYLRPAATDHVPEYKKIVESALENGGR